MNGGMFERRRLCLKPQSWKGTRPRPPTGLWGNGVKGPIGDGFDGGPSGGGIHRVAAVLVLGQGEAT